MDRRQVKMCIHLAVQISLFARSNGRTTCEGDNQTEQGQPLHFAERYRSATRVLGAGRASARHVTSTRVGCSAWLASITGAWSMSMTPRRGGIDIAALEPRSLGRDQSQLLWAEDRRGKFLCATT